MKTSIPIYIQFENLSNKNTLFVEKILERYKEVHNLKSNKQIAERMDLSESAFSNQKNRDSLDLKKLIASCDSDINLHWLLTGNGNPKINKDISRVNDQFSEYESSLNDLSKSETSRDEIVEFLVKQQEFVLDFLYKLQNED